MEENLCGSTQMDGICELVLHHFYDYVCRYLLVDVLHEFSGCRQIAVPDLLDQNDVIAVDDLEKKHQIMGVWFLRLVTLTLTIVDVYFFWGGGWPCKHRRAFTDLTDDVHQSHVGGFCVSK